jgi:hypothetical protein
VRDYAWWFTLTFTPATVVRASEIGEALRNMEAVLLGQRAKPYRLPARSRRRAVSYCSSEKAPRRTVLSARSIGFCNLAEPTHHFILCQHGQLVNANCRGRIQSSLAPSLNRDIEVGGSRMGGDGSGYEVIVALIEQHHGWT